MLAESRFVDLLAQVLPPLEFKLYHLKTHLKKCRKLVFTHTSDKSLDAYATHFFVLSLNGIDLMALEVYIYESRENTTMFVSKADTTGHYPSTEPPAQMGRVVQQLLRGLIRYYLPLDKPVRVCLFAKAERQYLFLGSAKNPAKHVLSDAQLVKWWARCLDGLKSEFSSVEKCALQIPGASEAAVKSYLPTDSQLPWRVGDIFWEGTPDDPTIAVKRIPRFPDDPKNRFLEYLVAEKRVKKVSRAQFWLELQSRQEFRLGTTVGIFGLEGTVGKHEVLEGNHSITQKEFKLLKEVTLEGDYSTKASAEYSSNEFASRVPSYAEIDIKGTLISPVAKRTIEKPQVHVLSAGLVRKKQKTQR